MARRGQTISNETSRPRRFHEADVVTSGSRGGLRGGGSHEEFNTRLFISCAIGGAIGTVIAFALIGALYKDIPNVLLFGAVMAAISLGVLIGAVTASGSYTNELPKTIAVALAGTVLMFAAAALFEFIYEIKIEPKPEETTAVQQQVPPTDYIFCIDDSGSMYGNDPKGLRNSSLASLLDYMDPSSKVGIIRFESHVKSGERVPMAFLDANQKALLIDLLSNYTDGGGTDFESPLQEALAEFSNANEQGRSQVVVLMTDGECYVDTQKWIDEYNAKGVTICAVYLGSGRKIPEVLTTLCDGTNGFAVKADKADELLSAYGQIVEATSNTTIKDPDYHRFLAGPREGTDRKNVLSIVERILFLGLLGLLLGCILFVMLGKNLTKQIAISGICGLLAGAIVEFGYLLGLESFSRIGLFLYIIVVANYTQLDPYIMEERVRRKGKDPERERGDGVNTRPDTETGDGLGQGSRRHRGQGIG